MKNKLIVLTTILFLGCSINSEPDFFDKEYVKTAKLLDAECAEKIRNYLSPMDLENDTTTITHVYVLDVKFDTALFDKEDLRGKFYIGLVFNSDSTNREILAFDSYFGSIHTCFTLQNQSGLLVYNSYGFWHNFQMFEKLKCFDLDSDIKLDIRRNETDLKYLCKADRNTWRGLWSPDTITYDKFLEKELNYSWEFSDAISDKTLKLINKSDTIISEYYFDGTVFSMKNFDTQFYLLTETSKCIIVYDIKNKLHHILRQQSTAYNI